MQKIWLNNVSTNPSGINEITMHMVHNVETIPAGMIFYIFLKINHTQYYNITFRPTKYKKFGLTALKWMLSCSHIMFSLTPIWVLTEPSIYNTFSRTSKANKWEICSSDKKWLSIQSVFQLGLHVCKVKGCWQCDSNWALL